MDSFNTGVNEYWNRLKSQCITTLGAHVPRYSKVAYFDYPVHSNIGDILIWKGTEKWMQEFSLQVVARRNILQRSLPPLSDEIIIICHGGGNFGDLYRHQDYRERVVARYPNNKIIILPQTIYYKDQKRLDKSAEILNSHKHLVIYARDSKSLNTALENFSERSFLCPDMATFLYPVHGSSTSQGVLGNSTLCLMRNDIEAPDDSVVGTQCDWVGDWMDVLGWRMVLPKLMQALFSFPGNQLVGHFLFRLWDAISDRLLDHVINHFRNYSHVVTSRMHGLIFSTMLGKSVCFIDNSYGKNTLYYNEWYKDKDVAAIATPCRGAPVKSP